MSKSAIKKSQFSSVNPPQTPHDNQRTQLDGQDSVLTMKSPSPKSASVIDSHPAFSVWWERWRREARIRVFPQRP
jgi:hypothetical protein